ncbi:hypothetical protein D7319_30750 [Streptomyces radicis]|uniref:Uncharacterized protein n=1 Tax=Streptomyces radicis TaxID=1750517 RepID=A0A3A9VSN7_9ACTN|nr:hypothetical protein D7319_30750 [Streptomyces radicis]RKN13850.1 hypothetical protein D7318_30340 [Streptomyces radicis]
MDRGGDGPRPPPGAPFGVPSFGHAGVVRSDPRGCAGRAPRQPARSGPAPGRCSRPVRTGRRRSRGSRTALVQAVDMYRRAG